MGVQLTFGTAGATGGGWSSQPGTVQPAHGETRHEPRWSMQRRAPKTWNDRNAYYSRWSFGCRFGLGNVSGSDGSPSPGRDLASDDLFEPYSVDGFGTQSAKFIRGVCVDSAGAVVASATVCAYRSSDFAFAGTAVSHQNDGSYAVPTTFPGVNHFVTAYKVGAPDIAGMSVNTLVPANLDGS